MNEMPSLPPSGTPPPVPPIIPNAPTVTASPLSRNLGDDPAEQAPITNIVAAIDAILRQPRRVMFQLRQPGAGRVIASLLTVAFFSAAIYGVVVGAFTGGSQLWIAPVKIVLGMAISALICLPSLYIFTCLSGSQAKLVEVFGLLSGLLMLMTILLVGFAPVAWIFSQSTESLAWMGALHLIFWFIAMCFGLRFLESGFSHSHARSAAGFRTWAVIFILVAVQMTTSLRPIIGKADTFMPAQKQFFLSHWIDCVKD
jgi:hypothetical protein